MDETEKRRITREAYKSLGMFAVESFYIGAAPIDWVTKRVVEVSGLENYTRLREADRPLLAFTGHFGNWELLGAYSREVIPAVTLAKPLHNPLMQEDLERTRQRHDLRIIWTGAADSVRQILSHVRQGERTVNFLVDQDARFEGIFVPFFGRPASTNPTPARLSVKYDLPILPCFLVRLGPTRHRMIVRPPLFPGDCGSPETEERVREMTARMTREIEDMVRLHPAQYFWFHRRWKTTPEEVERRREKQFLRRQYKAEKAGATQGP